MKNSTFGPFSGILPYLDIFGSFPTSFQHLLVIRLALRNCLSHFLMACAFYGKFGVSTIFQG